MSADSRTVDFLSVLYGLARRCGLDPAALGTQEAEALTEHLTTAARKAHRHYDWPDVVCTEERSLRPQFSPGTIYALDDEVYDLDTDTYYRAVYDSFSGQDLTDETYWEEITDLTRSLALLSAGDTPIGEVLGIWDSDPATDTGAQPLGYHLTTSAVQLEPEGPTTVWVRFRIPPPRFSLSAWAAGTTYLPGDRTFVSPHAYLCLEESTGTPEGPAAAPTRWRVQDLPELLEDAVKRLAKSEWLSAQSQDEKAIALARLATEDLDDASTTLSQHQGQHRRYAVANRSRTQRQFQPRRAAI